MAKVRFLVTGATYKIIPDAGHEVVVATPSGATRTST
jgi:hypothetical protein